MKEPPVGCASFFKLRDGSADDYSHVTTICSCASVGSMEIPHDRLMNYQLSTFEGKPIISYIKTGGNISVYLKGDYEPSTRMVNSVVISEKQQLDLNDIVSLPSFTPANWNSKLVLVEIEATNECYEHPDMSGDMCQ